MKIWWRRHEEDGNLNERPRSGRPAVLNAEQEAEIIERVTDNPYLTAKSLGREYGVSPCTISSIFLRHGVKLEIGANEFYHTDETRINRIAFCQMLLEQWDDNKFESLIFSDEKTFSTDTVWQTKVTHRDTEAIDPENLLVEEKRGHISCNYWGAIGIEGPITPIVQIGKRFNTPTYIKVIETNVIPVMDRFKRDGNPRIFVHCNSICRHRDGSTAAKVMSFFSRQTFELMEWPTRSPDLNPIKNVWSKMTHSMPQIHPKNDENLHATVVERWKSIGENQRMICLFFYLHTT